MNNSENVPVKSGRRYENEYKEFTKWCSKKNFKKYTENVLLDYFVEISNHVKASTLWVKYCMLKATLLARNNVFIGRFPKLVAFLKRKQEDYHPTRSKTLTVEQVEQFLTEAPDKEFLMVKVALILCIAGACRRDELTNLSTNDVKDLGSSILFNIKKPGIDKIFIVKNSENNSVDFVNLCKKYMSLRRKDTDHSRFFVQYKNHTCISQPVGINSFGKMPQRIATFLNLPEASLYTGHCFKSTSASLQADAGAEDILKWTTATEGDPKPLPTTAVFLPEALISFDSCASTGNEENINNDANFTRIKNDADEGDNYSATYSSSLTNACLENRVVCRFCLQNVNKGNCISLQFLQNSSSTKEEIKKSMEIKTKIKFSFPNLDLSLSSAPMICDLCATSVTSIYKFICQTMINQNTIKAYMTKKCIAGDVNLNDVVETKKIRIDEEVNLVVKKLSKQPEKNSQTKQFEIIEKLEQAAEVEINNIISEEGNSSDAGIVEVKVEPKDEYIGNVEYSDSKQYFIKEEEIKIESHDVDYETIQTTGESTSDVSNSSEKMDSTNIDEILCTSPELPEVMEYVLPSKSKTKYNLAYQTLTKWLKSKNSKLISENLLLAYFNEVSKKWQPPTLWGHYSMLKSTLHIHNNIQIERYRKVTAFLKQINRGYRVKKPKVFTPTEIEKFLKEAPDEKYLLLKVACIFGISTACSRTNLTKIKVGDVEEHGKIFLIKIANTETHAYRSFTVDEKLCDFIRKYIDSRRKHLHSNRFFLNWQNGKCTRQVMGMNKYGRIPKQIAEFLKLPDAHLYTGHCFRRTSTTLLADAGVSTNTIRRHVGWKSTEDYEEDSISKKIKISKLITEEIMIPVRNSKRGTPQLMQMEKEDLD